jgi:hypothetical protein
VSACVSEFRASALVLRLGPIGAQKKEEYREREVARMTSAAMQTPLDVVQNIYLSVKVATAFAQLSMSLSQQSASASRLCESLCRLAEELQRGLRNTESSHYKASMCIDDALRRLVSCVEPADVPNAAPSDVSRDDPSDVLRDDPATELLKRFEARALRAGWTSSSAAASAGASDRA